MTHEHEDYAHLAHEFVQHRLSPEQRLRVQELVMTSPEFLEVLTFELVLKRKMETLKQPLPDSMTRRVYVNIVFRSHEQLYKKVLQTVLKATLPAITRPMLGLLERSVLANEQL